MRTLIKSPAVFISTLTILSIVFLVKLFELVDEDMKTVAMETNEVTTQSARDLILNGADPTDLLEPTAAGTSTGSYDCKFGKIVGDTDTQSIDDSVYVAYNEGSSLIIQVSPLIPTFLIQTQNNFVSASEFQPDSATMSKLENLFSNRDKCLPVDLYLSRIDLPNQNG